MTKPKGKGAERKAGAAEADRPLRDVPLDHLFPHPMNSNEMPPDRLLKLRNNIRRTGNYPPLIVRPHPEHPGAYQILDGAHRLKVLRDLGHTTARCDVWEVDDREARVLLATLNRLEGQDIPVRRAELLDQILHDISEEDLAALIPEEVGDIHSSLELLRFPLDDLEAELEEEERQAEERLPRTITVVVTRDQESDIDAAMTAAAEGLDGKQVKGLSLARICREWAADRGVVLPPPEVAGDEAGGGPPAAEQEAPAETPEDSL